MKKCGIFAIRMRHPISNMSVTCTNVNQLQSKSQPFCWHFFEKKIQFGNTKPIGHLETSFEVDAKTKTKTRHENSKLSGENIFAAGRCWWKSKWNRIENRYHWTTVAKTVSHGSVNIVRERNAKKKCMQLAEKRTYAHRHICCLIIIAISIFDSRTQTHIHCSTALYFWKRHDVCWMCINKC